MTRQEIAGNHTEISLGGQGEIVPDISRSDIALKGRAIKQRWPITDEQRQLIIWEMERIALNAKDERTRVGAAKVFIEADKMNLDGELGGRADGESRVPCKVYLNFNPVLAICPPQQQQPNGQE